MRKMDISLGDISNLHSEHLTDKLKSIDKSNFLVGLFRYFSFELSFQYSLSYSSFNLVFAMSLMIVIMV